MRNSNYEQEFYMDGEELDRNMIDSGNYIYSWMGFEVDMEDGPTVQVYAFMPCLPAHESDDLYIADSQGHDYNSSLMRDNVCAEILSADPYLFATQMRGINNCREHLNAVARHQM